MKPMLLPLLRRGRHHQLRPRVRDVTHGFAIQSRTSPPPLRAIIRHLGKLLWGSLFAAGQLLDSQRKKMLGIFDTALDELHNFLGDQAGRLVVTIVAKAHCRARTFEGCAHRGNRFWLKTHGHRKTVEWSSVLN